MIRNLLIISGAGLVLAIVGIGGAFAVGGADLTRHSWSWVVSEKDDNFRFERAGPQQPDIQRTIEWSGSESLAIDMPVTVVYDAASSETGIFISGPKDYVDAVKLDGNRLTLDDNDMPSRGYIQWTGAGVSGSSERDRLTVRIKGGAVKAFTLSGQTDLEVNGYNQPSLDLTLVGNADAEFKGTTQSLKIDASGYNSVKLDELLTRDATIRVSGDASVRTSADGKVEIDGSGDTRVRLTRQPGELRQTLSGEAEVVTN